VSTTLNIRHLGLVEYHQTYEAMQSFTDQRTAETADEIWLLEHPPVFTQGRAGKAEHLLSMTEIPVVQSDRGGQVTYHGPGQLTAYVLIDVKRRGSGVRDLVTTIEQAIVKLLADFEIEAAAKADAPGVYVQDDKIASLGLRIRKGCSFHGLALNIDMDMTPFLQINPCGYSGLKMIQMSDFCPQLPSVDEVGSQLAEKFIQLLNYEQVEHYQGLPVEV
jgi:lipoyl(octanoyl) transferase